LIRSDLIVTKRRFFIYRFVIVIIIIIENVRFVYLRLFLLNLFELRPFGSSSSLDISLSKPIK
jgi:hypothetical protein